jgi:hypothetical protein
LEVDIFEVLTNSYGEKSTPEDVATRTRLLVHLEDRKDRCAAALHIHDVSE